MIAQYIIDWKCVGNRIDCASSARDIEKLRGLISSLREKIAENGVLIVDDDSEMLKALNVAQSELAALIPDDESEDYAAYFDMQQELSLFLTVYENNSYRIECSCEGDDIAQKCVHAWRNHTKMICPQGIKGGVIVTDRKDLDHVELLVESWESYGGSEVETTRKQWLRGLAFNERNSKEFTACLNAFAATSYGEVQFVDKYWGSIGVLNVGGGSTTRQQRYINSTMRFLAPFLKNPDVKCVDFITTIPKYENGEEAPCFCVNCEDGICEKVKAMVASRKGELNINVMFVEPNASDAQFHNRYMINNSWTVALLNGMDICNRSGALIDFQMILFGVTSGSDNLSRGHVVSHRIRKMAQHEVDIPNPYVVSIRDNPRVLFSLKG